MARDPKYDILFEPVKIGPVTVPNRFFQVPHCNVLGHGRPRAEAANRRVKAEGGWGVVCSQEVEIHPSTDASPFIEGRIWDRVDELSAQFEKDDFVQVSGKATVYMGKMQLVLKDLQRLEETAIELADFLPVSTRSTAEMMVELKTVVDALVDPDLNSLMQTFLADEEFMAGYTRAPAAKAMHHVYLGGLLEHSLAVALLAKDICQRYPNINSDLLVVGALLHDVGKVAELRYQRSFEYTDMGKLLGHIVIGVEMVEEKMRDLPAFPLELAIHLKHLLLSHHGQYEYGSPKRPKTMEAVILNFLDDLDSKINGVRTHIEREPDSDSSWTQYHRLYDRYFFNGYSPDGATYFAMSFGVYPHLNISDAAFSVIVDGIQHAVHASKIIHMERLSLNVGPISIDVIEPLEKLRIQIDDQENGIKADLLFTRRCVAVEEPRFQYRNGPRMMLDYTRLTQNGTWEGTINLQGKEINVSPKDWFGTRDRSWGVRPIGVGDGHLRG